MLHTIFIKCLVDVMDFIFIFISPSVPRPSVKMSVNQSIKIKGLIIESHLNCSYNRLQVKRWSVYDCRR